MKSLLSALLALLMLLPLLVSCGGTSSPEDGSQELVSSFHEDLTETEPISTGEKDPFEGADALPADLQVPECVKNAEGTVIGTIVLPPAATSDTVLSFAAEELRYHIEKVTGASLPIVGRTGEGYGSIVLATPDTLPFIAEQFADDIAWLADLGSVESGSRYGSDGFAIRKLGDSIYVFGNTSKGAMNGVYDLIEDNLGVLWTRASEEKGLIYDELEEATISKVDYREKSPFDYRGFLWGSERTNAVMLARNKCNTVADIPDLGMRHFNCGHSIFHLLKNSPIYDREETEYWETDDQGNCLGPDGSAQVNPWSEKAAEVIAANIIAQMQANPEVRYVFIGEEDRSHGRVVPYDTEPFEYAPGEFVYPEDRNFYSTVFHTMINKIARMVREAVPDGRVGTFAYGIGKAAPACDIEDNIRICVAPIGEDYTACIFDTSIQERVKDKDCYYNCEDVPAWLEKAESVVFWHYYICNAFGTEYSWPIWYRIQEDLRIYMTKGVEGVTSDGLPDLDQGSSWLDYNGAKGTCSNYWDMNVLLCWLFQKLLWNPNEDLPSLITYFCDKVYGDASPYMQEYYHLMEQGFKGATETRRKQTSINLRSAEFYQFFVRKQDIGHPILDALEAAYQAASGPIKEDIKYMYDCVYRAMSAYKTF